MFNPKKKLSLEGQDWLMLPELIPVAIA